jgi:DNA (cytosine-5)-methyltransferase 1
VRVLSLFSGVGGMDLGLERAGHEVVGMCEIDKHARSVLAHHWPGVPIHDDVTTLETEEWNERVDLVAGGSPCQDLSVAGKRAGLDGARSGLFWHQCRIADQVAAPWILWENVAGALNSNNGADFAAVLWGITGALPDVPDEGWKSAGVCVGPKRTAVWRLLDAQWFGVAQRRRRVFVVGGPRGHCGPEILLESESVRRDSAPSRKARKEVAGTLGSSPRSRGRFQDISRVTCEPDVVRPTILDDDRRNGPSWSEEVTPTLTGRMGTGGNNMPMAFVPDVVGTVTAKWAKQSGGYAGNEVANLVLHNSDEDLCGTISASWRYGVGNTQVESGICIPVATAGTTTGVRRLTPRECERLMGWPDDWTRYTVDGKEQADSHRYKQCGNGVVSNVAEWIGRRLP